MNARTPLAAALLATGMIVSTLAPQPASADRARRACATPIPTLGELKSVGLALRQQALVQRPVGGRIQVAWHVITWDGVGDLPLSQIQAQIEELNRAYSGRAGGVNTGYRFELASVDRTEDRRWFRVAPFTGTEKQMKTALAIDPAHRLNVYSANIGRDLAGWAYFPNSFPESSPMHGAVIHYGTLPGGSVEFYDLGGTLDHEVGHYLGLYHTFQGGCTEPGDLVDDTPFEAVPNYGCVEGKDTCPSAGLDPIHNYMDYSDDVCYTEFTAGQDERMDRMVPLYRPSLLNASLAQADLAPANAIEPALALPAAISFRGAVPNPFQGETDVHFSLPRAARVSLRVYNVAGQLVSNLVDGEMPAGEQSVRFRAGRLAPGMYFTALRVNGESMTRSVILIH